MNDLQELQKLVSVYTASILYIPIQSEIDYSNPLFVLKIPDKKFTLPKEKNSDPFELVFQCIDKFKNDKVLLLIPGKSFDKYGTRHGRGGGWFDRFLSEVPPEWLRIGVIDKSGLSNSKLPKQEWDQVVDWVLIQDGSSWIAHKIYKTL